MNSVAFTGYRPEKMPFNESKNDINYNKFREVLLKVINRLIECGYTDFISGMAQGFDTWCAEDILNIKKNNSLIALECAIPFPDQAKSWPFSDKIRRKRLLRLSDSRIIVSSEYSKDCYFARNRYMVDKADVVVCAYDGQKGGTAYTVNYALKQDKIVVQINPSTLKVTIISKKTFHQI